MTQQIAAVFDEPNAARVVEEELLERGFKRDDIAIVAQDVRSESERMLSTMRKGLVTGALLGLAIALAAVFMADTRLALAGATFAVLSGAALGALVGGLAGGILGRRVPPGTVQVIVNEKDHSKPAEYPRMRAP